MRHYPINSPQAAARVVMLFLVADGHLSHRDLDAVRRLRIADRLGLDGPEWHDVLTAFCQDLLLSSHTSWQDVCRLESEVLAQMMSEIVDARLRRTVLELSLSLAESDGPLSQSESSLLDTAMERWGLAESAVQRAHA